MAIRGTCRECGAKFEAKRAARAFCKNACRMGWTNRRLLRGAEFYDLFMSMRHERQAAEQEGAWNLACRMAAHYKELDDRDRAGLPATYDTIAHVRERNVHLLATVVSRGMNQRPGLK